MVITDRLVLMLVLVLALEIEPIQNTAKARGTTWQINRTKASSIFKFSNLRDTYAPSLASRS
jgi:hypothetical protein